MTTRDHHPHLKAASKIWSTRRVAVMALVAAGLSLVVAAAMTLNFNETPTSTVPPVAATAQTQPATPDAPSFDHRAFDAILRQHVNARGGVDYAALIQDPEPLRAYNRSLAAAPWDRLGRDEKLALLINAYNSFTLELMVDWLPRDDVRGIRDIPEKESWDAVRWNIGGHVWSLNQIEHEQIRPVFKEPRIHWAVVCAAVGCPPLRPEAYVADRLDEQLADQEKIVHAGHTRWFRFDADGHIIHLTRLYEWYEGDFVQADGSVLDYVAKRVDTVAEARRSGRRLRIQWLDYDWSLNSTQNLR